MNDSILGWLRGDTPNVQGQEFAITQREIIIGRGTQSHFQLSDPKISRMHARLRIGPDRIILEDLNSAHGTLVNGMRGNAFVLSDGDVIALGDTLLVFKTPPDAVATQMAPSGGASAYVAPAMHTPPEPSVIPVDRPLLDGEDRSPIGMFMFGLIPALLIGVAVIVIIIILGGEPDGYKPPERPQDQAASTPAEGFPSPTMEVQQEVAATEATTADQTETATSQDPEFIVRPRDPDADESLPDLMNRATYNESESSVEMSIYDAEILYGESFVISYFQCAIDESTLIENLNVTSIEFRVDEVILGLDDLALSEMDRGDKYCYTYGGVVSGLTPGSHEIESRYEQSEPIFDGFESYPPGSFSTLYRVEVVSSEVTDESRNGSMLNGLSVTLHVGDARFFTEPPLSVAYANTQGSVPPADVMITENCGTSCWRYNEWVALAEPGQYLEAESTVSTTAIGVQLWGDDNDGWARISVDGDEVWKGDMRGSDNKWPGGAFVRYLQVSGLEPGNHTLRFEPTGEGGSVTVYFFGIGEVQP